MNLIFLGPPGAGKGTHAEMLSKSMRLSHLAAGDILRRNIREGTALGMQARDIMARGELVPDTLVNNMMFAEIRELRAKGAKGFILDGYPRTIVQAQELDKFLASEKMTLSAAINFDASEEVVVARLSGRRLCPVDGKIYHVKNMPPRKEGVCDCHGQPLVTRKDDQPDTIRKRLAVYHESTKPLIEYYAKNDLLRNVPADGDAPAVQKLLEKLFETIR
ncbi:MAG TPA: adenylate kinase [Candidatus Omnitrophota bacterium]|jgi:adenylate kinase|nr:adenylate kinase [Candidatus Omnitrophota bacterium]HQB93799.1 adenylate kinase [Candidatus Omnitrophota bacterium]